MADSKAPTHTAYGRQRIGRTHGQWLEIGTARLETTGDINVILNRTILGGFSGHVYLAKIGGQPPAAEVARPDQLSEDDSL
jgi:hypothetical protein